MSELFSSDSELAVLSTLLNNPDLAYTVGFVKPFMFNATPNALIFSSIQDLASKNYVPDVSLVISNLESSGAISTAGGVDYIKYIASMPHKKENLLEYSRLLVESFKARKLISITSGIQEKLHTSKGVSSVLIDIRKNLDLLEESSGEEITESIYDASSDTWDVIVDRVHNPGIRGVTTGYTTLDTITGGYNKGDFWIVAGRPGSGKSAQMCNTALLCAKKLKESGSNESILIFSLEMDKIQIVERLISIESHVPLADIRLGTLTQSQLDKISSAIKIIKDLPIIIDTNFGADEAYFSNIVRKYKKLKNVRVVFFDYVQLSSERGESQTMELGRFSRSSKLLANDLKITVIVYSQLNRGVELREDKHPILSDLRQSGSLEEDADIVLFLYREEYYNKDTKNKGVMEQIIAKHRNGPVGSLFFNFDSTSVRIME